MWKENACATVVEEPGLIPGDIPIQIRLVIEPEDVFIAATTSFDGLGFGDAFPHVFDDQGAFAQIGAGKTTRAVNGRGPQAHMTVLNHRPIQLQNRPVGKFRVA